MFRLLLIVRELEPRQLGRFEVILRLLVGVIPIRDLPGLQLVVDPEFIHEDHVFPLIDLDPIRDLESGRAFFVGLLIHANYHFVRISVMLEEVKYPFLFHQPRDEIEIRFAILHNVISGFPVDGPQVQFIRVVNEDLLQDLRYRHVLENAAPMRLREQPHGRDKREPVIRKSDVPVQLCTGIHHGVEGAGRPVLRRQVDGDVLPQYLGNVQDGRFRAFLLLDVQDCAFGPGEFGDLLNQFDTLDDEVIVLERRSDL